MAAPTDHVRLLLHYILCSLKFISTHLHKKRAALQFVLNMGRTWSANFNQQSDEPKSDYSMNISQCSGMSGAKESESERERKKVHFSPFCRRGGEGRETLAREEEKE